MIDRVKIYAKAGDGGHGAVSFRREKFVPRGGPNGGDGGRGGDVWLVANPNLTTLQDFKYKSKFTARRADNGGQSLCSGKDGEDLEINVPIGTLVRKEKEDTFEADLSQPGQKYLLLKGGRGGRGNNHFKSSTHQAPRFAENGEEGEEGWYLLELKLLADVGLVGLPNAGKSTLLSIVSAAKPKIADYPFTTLEPNLGVVEHKGKSFVMADIPGLIEGAHQGAGLGFEFLRHIERTRVLLHLVDLSLDSDPYQDYLTIQNEMTQFEHNLPGKPCLVLANKMDLPEAKEKFPDFAQKLEAAGKKVFPVSTAIREGIDPVLTEVITLLAQTPLPDMGVRMIEEEISQDKLADLSLEKLALGRYRLSCQYIEKIMKRYNFDQDEAVQRWHYKMKRWGIISYLRENGVTEGDTVIIGEMEFEFD